MQAFHTRLSSFSKSKRVKPSSGKSSSSVSLKWPHPSHFTANPDTLADAGFYFSPTWEDRDNVQCFMCDKELSDWNSDDDPYKIHWEKCHASCAWAIVRCGLGNDVDSDGRFVFPDPERVPSRKGMEKARLETFDGWPHDSRNHGANPKKMSHAGFVYTPQVAGDDTATCLYCDISLSGWDADDDPLEEHRKRETKAKVPCPFLSPDRNPSASSKPASLSKGSTTTKNPSQSRSRSKKHIEPEAPTGQQTLASDDELLVPSDVGITAPPRPRKTTGRSKSRSKSAKSVVPSDDIAVEGTGVDAAQEVEEPVVTKKPKRGRSKAKEKPDVPPDGRAKELEENVAVNSEIPRSRPVSRNDEPPAASGSVSEQPKLRPQRSVKGKKSTRELASNAGGSDAKTSPASKPKSKRKTTKSKAAGISSIDRDQGTVPENEVAAPKQPAATIDRSSPAPIPPTSPPEQPWSDPVKNLPGDPSVSLIPPLAVYSVDKSDPLSERELDMTVEEWIRYELIKQYEHFRLDGERVINVFKERAAEVRQMIESI